MLHKAAVWGESCGWGDAVGGGIGVSGFCYPGVEYWAEYGSEGDIKYIVESFIAGGGAWSKELLSAEVGYYEKECCDHEFVCVLIFCKNGLFELEGQREMPI